MIRHATPLVLALLAIATMTSSPASAATTKASGVPDSSALQLTFLNESAALVQLDQNWEGVRGDEMRQSLDAYFGNGDGKLSSAEIARITAAASKDMLGKTFAPLTVDGASVRVTSVSVTMDGTDANLTGTRLVIHHAITLAIPPIDGRSHALVLASTWNGTYDITPPDGLVVNGKDPGPVTGPLSSGTSLAFTLAPPTPPPAIASPNESIAAPAPAPGPVLPTGRGVPGPALTTVILAIGVAALLVARSRRR